MVHQYRNWVSNPAMGEKRSGVSTPWEPYSEADYSTEEQWTQSHSRLNGRWSGGGPWTLNRNTIYRNSVNVSNTFVRGTACIGGPRFSVANPTSLPAHSDATLIGFGTSAIAKTEPTNPAFSLSEFIGELRREGLPNLPGSTLRDKTNYARSAGSEYLNVEFGWAPLVRGVRDFAKAVRDADETIVQYNRDSGRLIRREMILGDEAYRTNGGGTFTSSPSSALGSMPGSIIKSRIRKTWFSGAYTYYLPTGNGVSDRFARYGSYARRILGVELTPEVMWNLAPWTWALDWFGNMGDIVHNVSAIGRDGLVLKYGYIMSHTQYDEQWTCKSSAGQLYMRNIVENKRRMSATPYGFGVDLGALSSKQTAILVALGLSRT